MADIKTEVVTADSPESADQVLSELKGSFVQSLRRGNKEIKSDRALAIAEDAEQEFRRYVEDMIRDIKRMRRDRLNLLDQSPDNTQTLKIATSFDAKTWVNQYQALGVKIKDAEMRLAIARDGYKELFGQEIGG